MERHLCEEVQVVRADHVNEVTTTQTRGFVRRELMAQPWGRARSESYATGECFGLDHHGDYDTSIYVVSGALRMEFGPGGRGVIDAVPGDFLHVPKGAIHREGNPSAEAADLIVTRAGTGPPVINVDGPEPD